MSTIFIDAAAWNSLAPEDQAAALVAAQVPVRLGDPATLTGTFDADGTFVQSDAGTAWYAWDDGRLTEEHAVALAAALEV